MDLLRFVDTPNLSTPHSAWFVVLVVVLVLLLIGHAVYAYSTAFTRTLTIRKTYTGVDSASSDSHGSDIFTTYNVVASSGQVYEVVNSLWYWSWNKVDTWGAMRAGGTYRVTGYGVYSGFMGWVPYILTAHPV